MSQARFNTLQRWLNQTLKDTQWQIEKLAGDASFRHYYRVRNGAQNLIVMDAPPQQEDCRPFINVARAFKQADICAPEILAEDLAQGFLLLTDLGDQLLLPLLKQDNVDDYYLKSFTILESIQSRIKPDNIHLPHFDETLLMRELQLFPAWFLQSHLHWQLNTEQQKILHDSFELLIANALNQPQVFVHRDFHSRNLMLTQEQKIGVIDFQDAVWGPITYDLISLIRDCYIAWPTEKVYQWAEMFYEMLSNNPLIQQYSKSEFIQWLDWMSVQRHLKVMGIFARLCYRDNKPQYLNDTPRILNYLLDVCSQYPALNPLLSLLKSIEAHRLCAP